MNINIDFSDLEKLEKNIEKVEGEKHVELPDLMPDDFIRKHTNFQSLQAMLNAGGVKDCEDIEGIDSDAFSNFIATHTRFAGWPNMCEFASGEWVRRQLES
jgi:hypothetical protein